MTLSTVAGLPVANFDFKTGFSPSSIKYYEEVMAEMEVILKERGLDRYYVLVGSQKDYDFARWMGYEVTGQHIKDTQYEILGKAL